MRPLWALRYFVRLGASMLRFPQPRHGPSAAYLLFLRPLVLRHRVVSQDLALEYPDLHAAGAIGRLRGRLAVVDVGAQRVKGNPPLAIPLGTGDLRPPETAGAGDPDSLRAEAHRGLHGPLHGAAKGDPTLELLRDVLGHELGVEF